MSLSAPPSYLTVLSRYVNSSVDGRFGSFDLNRWGFLCVQGHHVRLLQVNFKANLLCKGVKAGCFFLHVLLGMGDQCQVVCKVKVL